MANEDKIRREMDVLDITLTTKAQRTALTIEEYIAKRAALGTSIEQIKADLLDDLNNGGPMFKEFTNAVKATVHGNSMRLSDVSQFSEHGLNLKYRWSAVLVNTCPDCIERHGQVKTMDEWEEEGIPRSGHTVCGEHCKCVLLPAETTKLIEPVKRSK